MLKQKENPVTSQFVPLLREMSPGWRMEEQQTIFEDSSRTPDVIVTRDGHETVAIEAKWTDSPKDGVAQVRSRYLGRRLCPDFVGVSETLRAAMVVRYPINLRDKSGADIRTLLKKAEDIEYLPPRYVSAVCIRLSSRGTGARARHRPLVSQKDLTFLARYAIL